MGKVFYGQEPPSGESTTTECAVNYQLLAAITEVAQFGTPSCSRPQSATDNGVRDGRSNWLVTLPTLMDSTPWAPRALYKSVQLSHSQDSFLQPCNLATFSMRGNHLAYDRGHSGSSGNIYHNYIISLYNAISSNNESKLIIISIGNVDKDHPCNYQSIWLTIKIHYNTSAAYYFTWQRIPSCSNFNLVKINNVGKLMCLNVLQQVLLHCSLFCH